MPCDERDPDRSPIILVHGAANSSLVWTFWQQELTALDWRNHAVDLRGHGAGPPADLADTSMRDYADDVASVAERFPIRPIVVGWSMGGLVALMVAARDLASACVALAPSVPTWRVDARIPLRHGLFGPEEYGIATREISQQPAMPDLDAEERAVALSSLGLESRLARAERRRGVVVRHVPCPLLIVTAEQDVDWPRAKYDRLRLPAEYVRVEGCSHWGLVLNRRAVADTVPVVSRWMAHVTRR
jgi:pimeloyl-ACP methyl ester carboxylesterase